MYLLRRTSEIDTTTLPVTVAQARAFLRVDIADDDSLIEDLIVAAVEYVEDRTWTTICRREYELVLPGFPGSLCFMETDSYVRARPDSILLPRPPVISVDLVRYVDSAGDAQTLAPSAYVLTQTDGTALLAPAQGASWPGVYADHPEPVVIAYTAGPSGQSQPQVRQAVRMLVAHWYEHREAVLVGLTSKDIEHAVDQLCLNAASRRF